MSFHKRHISTSSLLSRFQSDDFQSIKDWVLKPDHVYTGDPDGIASQFVRLLFADKDDAAYKLLSDAAKDFNNLQGQMQNLMKSYAGLKDTSSKDYLMERMKELEVQMRKYL